MSNEVEIKVKSTDKTDYSKIKSKAKAEGGKAGDDAGKEFGVRLGKSASKGAERGGQDSGKSFGKSLRKWFAVDGSKLIGQGGQITGESFKSGFSGILKTPVIGPIIAGALVGAAAIAAPAAGAIAASGLVLGFGAGLAGLGIVLASKSKVVQDKWAATMKSVGEKSKLMAKPFESTLVGIAGTFERTFSRFEPTLTRVFGKMAGPVRSFADDVGTALEGLLPALDPLADGFNAVLASLGPALQSAIGEISAGLSDLADSVKRNPDGLADMVKGIGDVVRTTLDFVGVLNDVNGQFKTLTGGTSMVTATFGILRGALMPLLLPFVELNFALKTLNGWTKPVGDGFRYTAQTAAEAAETTKLWTQGLDAAQIAAMGITGGTKEAGKAAETLTDKFNRQKSKTDALIDSLFRLQNGYLTLSGAQISYQAALDAGTQSVKDNGKTLDINTEKGRANKQSLIDLAKAANDQTESMIRNNKGSAAAARAAETSRANFVRLAQQMGATKPQAEAMARSMIAIPNVSRTAKLTANIAELQSRLKTAKTELANKNLTKERRAQLTAEISKLESGIARAKTALNSVPPSKTVTITTRYVTNGTPAQKSRAASQGHTPGNWHGGPVMPGLARGGSPLSAREFMAGEYGKEIVKVDGTGNVSVTPAGNTARRMGQQGGGVQEVRLVIEGHGDVGDFLIKMLQPAVRNRGGNLNVIFAGRAS